MEEPKCRLTSKILHSRGIMSFLGYLRYIRKSIVIFFLALLTSLQILSVDALAMNTGGEILQPEKKREANNAKGSFAHLGQQEGTSTLNNQQVEPNKKVVSGGTGNLPPTTTHSITSSANNRIGNPNQTKAQKDYISFKRNAVASTAPYTLRSSKNKSRAITLNHPLDSKGTNSNIRGASKNNRRRTISTQVSTNASVNEGCPLAASYQPSITSEGGDNQNISSAPNQPMVAKQSELLSQKPTNITGNNTCSNQTTPKVNGALCNSPSPLSDQFLTSYNACEYKNFSVADGTGPKDLVTPEETSPPMHRHKSTKRLSVLSDRYDYTQKDLGKEFSSLITEVSIPVSEEKQNKSTSKEISLGSPSSLVESPNKNSNSIAKDSEYDSSLNMEYEDNLEYEDNPEYDVILSQENTDNSFISPDYSEKRYTSDFQDNYYTIVCFSPENPDSSDNTQNSSRVGINSDNSMKEPKTTLTASTSSEAQMPISTATKECISSDSSINQGSNGSNSASLISNSGISNLSVTEVPKSNPTNSGVDGSDGNHNTNASGINLHPPESFIKTTADDSLEKSLALLNEYKHVMIGESSYNRGVSMPKHSVIKVDCSKNNISAAQQELYNKERLIQGKLKINKNRSLNPESSKEDMMILCNERIRLLKQEEEVNKNRKNPSIGAELERTLGVISNSLNKLDNDLVLEQGPTQDNTAQSLTMKNIEELEFYNNAINEIIDQDNLKPERVLAHNLKHVRNAAHNMVGEAVSVSLSSLDSINNSHEVNILLQRNDDLIAQDSLPVSSITGNANMRDDKSLMSAGDSINDADEYAYDYLIAQDSLRVPESINASVHPPFNPNNPQEQGGQKVASRKRTSTSVIPLGVDQTSSKSPTQYLAAPSTTYNPVSSITGNANMRDDKSLMSAGDSINDADEYAYGDTYNIIGTEKSSTKNDSKGKSQAPGTLTINTDAHIADLVAGNKLISNSSASISPSSLSVSTNICSHSKDHLPRANYKSFFQETHNVLNTSNPAHKLDNNNLSLAGGGASVMSIGSTLLTFESYDYVKSIDDNDSLKKEDNNKSRANNQQLQGNKTEPGHNQNLDLAKEAAPQEVDYAGLANLFAQDDDSLKKEDNNKSRANNQQLQGNKTEPGHNQNLDLAKEAAPQEVDYAGLANLFAQDDDSIVVTNPLALACAQPLPSGSGVTGTIATNALTAVQFNAGGTAIALTGNAAATDFTFGAADVVTATGTITGNVDFANNAGTLNAAGLITGNVDSTGGANGTLNLTGAGSGANGTRVNSATIAGDSTISNDLHADVITVGAHELTLTKDAIFNGVTGFTDTTLNLAGHDLTMKGGNVTFNGASTIKTTVAGAGLNLGNLVAGDGSTIILAGANTLKIEVDDKAVLPVDGQNLKLIAKAGNGILQVDPAKVTVTTTSTFSKWTPKVINGEFVLTQVSQIQEVISAAIEEAGLSDVVSKDVAQAIEDYEEGTAGEDFALQLHQMTYPNIADATTRITNTTSNAVSEVNLEFLNEIINIISSRVSDMGNFLGSSFNPTATNATKSTKVSSENNYISGVAAGDENNRFGVWATPFYSKSTQKKRSGTSGFKADSYGGTFGADTRVNDNMILGAAFTAMNTDIKHKDFKSGDKTKVSTYLLSIYGLHQFTNNWFGQGVVSIGSSSVNNKENRRISNTQLAIAEGKYSSMTFATEVLAGYNHMFNDQLVVTPMLGLNYNRINEGSYNESGAAAGPQLMEVTKKASQKLDIVGGVKVETKPIILNGVAITPEVHAFVRHDVIGKGAKVNAKISGLSLLLGEKAKLQKTFYEVGTSLDASYGSMDYGISADATFAKKYVGVQGALKLRVNF